MRNLAIFFAVIAAVLPSSVSGQLALAGSAADEFGKIVLTIHAKTTTCRDQFNPHEALIKFDYAKGTMQKSEELDQREPGVTNHVMTWQFSGLSLTSFTYFSFYGPSTWLRRMEISRPSELAHGLKFGDSVQRFAKILGVSEDSIRLNRVHVDRADVTFVVSDKDAIRSIILECIAD